MIEAVNLSKDRVSGFLARPRRVLHHLNLKVEEGITFGLLGPNGAGKTTTIKLFLGLLKATEGTASVLGFPAGSREALAQIGFLPENPYFYSHLTGKEFLDFVASLFKIGKALKQERISQLLHEVGLEEHAAKPMASYSKGMLQRLGIAQALINDPLVLFLDEPMSGLDPLGRMEMRTIIKNLKARKKTIFFNSHLLPDVQELCDEIGILVEGHLVAQGKVSAIGKTGHYQELEDYFLAQVESFQNPANGGSK